MKRETYKKLVEQLFFANIIIWGFILMAWFMNTVNPIIIKLLTKIFH